MIPELSFIDSYSITEKDWNNFINNPVFYLLLRNIIIKMFDAPDKNTMLYVFTLLDDLKLLRNLIDDTTDFEQQEKLKNRIKEFLNVFGIQL